MKKLVWTMALCLLALVSTNEGGQEREYKQIMIELGATFQSLGRNISLENVFAITDARDAEKLAKEVVDYWQKTPNSDAVRWAKNVENGTAEVIAAINRSQWQQAEEAMAFIRTNCEACHKVYRPGERAPLYR